MLVKEQVKVLLWGEAFDRHRMEASLSDVIVYLKEVEAQILSKYPDAIEVGLEHEYGYYDEPDSWVLSYSRWETDEEYEKRILKSKKAEERKEKQRLLRAKKKAEQEEYERQEYERLKKKFGDS